MSLALLAVSGLVRAPARTAVRILVLSAAVALLAAMIVFVGHALNTMTGSAVRSVPLDWQGPVSSYRAARRTAAGVASQTGVLHAVPAATAPFAALEHTAAGVGTIRAGAGAILAVAPSYATRFHTLRLLRGSLRPGGIVLDQQLAATLQAQPGDTISLAAKPGSPPVRLPVSGIALVTAADVLFQPLDPLLGPAPAQPPANVLVVPLATFASRIAPRLTTVTTAPAGSAAALPGAPAGVQWQVQAQVDPASLTGSPSTALQRAGQIRNRVERSLPGQVQFVDNLSDSLDTAVGDSLYAQTLFIMLAVPGALIALGLAYLAALGTADRDRRDLALLRARGARRRDLLTVAGVESVVLGAVSGVLGAAAGIGAAALVVSGSLGITTGRAIVTFAVCVVIATMGAAAARIGGSMGVLQSTVSEGRRSVRRAGKPLWQRLYLDVVALALSGLVYWLTLRTGFSAVVNPDSNPTLSLSVYMFFAPALLWIGATLLLVRLRGRAVGWLVGRAAGGSTPSWRSLLLASASRRGPAINRGLVLVALLLAFGVALGVFEATYDQQARVDAQLTLGADVVVTAPPGVAARRHLMARISRLSGVAGTAAVDHSYAYVGPDLQDTFGIDPANLPRGTTLRDSYFLGGSAGAMLARLRSTPDGILVSKETITDYSLRLGDLLRLRLLDRAQGKFRVVPFHVVGVVQEFPAAPRDSFMVTNLAYLEHAANDGGANVIFVKAAGDPVALHHRIEAATRSAGTVVDDIRHQTAQTVSSITTVDLTGISHIEEAFALALVALAMALFVAVSLGERRQELATMAALGASLRRVAAFLWSEAALVLAAGIALAALLGWLLAEMLVAMLQHVFDPPPDHLAAPWGFLAALGCAAALGTLAAGLVAWYGVRRFPLGAILREE
jgi:putative ABC transport system permease protein